MRRLRCTLVTAITTAVTISACGGSTGSSACVTDDSNDAHEVCVVGPTTRLAITASGLAPGSVFTSATEKTGEGTYIVTDSGDLGGEIGFLGDYDGETITVSGTWDSGKTFAADLTISP